MYLYAIEPKDSRKLFSRGEKPLKVDVKLYRKRMRDGIDFNEQALEARITCSVGTTKRIILGFVVQPRDFMPSDSTSRPTT